MKNDMNEKIFLFISLEKTIIFALNSKKQDLYKKELSNLDSKIFENSNELNNFLDKNIFSLEKKLNRFVNNINLIINHDDFFSINLSVKNRSEFKKMDISQINNLLLETKNHVKKSLYENKIVHMKINKFVIDGKDYISIPDDIDSSNFFVEVEFICLPKKLIKNVEKILINYQISINKILSYEYLCNFKSNPNENIFIVADNILNGLNQNEVFLINKSAKNKGIFEKFFNFFN